MEQEFRSAILQWAERQVAKTPVAKNRVGKDEPNTVERVLIQSLCAEHFEQLVDFKTDELRELACYADTDNARSWAQMTCDELVHAVWTDVFFGESAASVVSNYGDSGQQPLCEVVSTMLGE